MKVNDYVRTDEGLIGKVIKKEEYDTYVILQYEGQYCKRVLSTTGTDSEVIKSSSNIIDLIEVGDYVNGLPVERIGRTLDDENDIRVWFGVATYGKTALNQINHRYTVKDEFEDDYSLRFRCIKPKDIKSIVTKEQFESMKYEVK